MSLIQANGYSDVTTRDIARAANVSNGLVFKYFPAGKPEIVKVLVLKELIQVIYSIYIPNVIQHDDFPEYLRKALSDAVAYERKYHQLYVAITIASLSDKRVFEGFKDRIDVDEAMIMAFFRRFKGINVDDRENLTEFITQWLDIINGAIMHHLMFPSAFATDKKLVDMLVEISLKLWDYDRTRSRPTSPVG